MNRIEVSESGELTFNKEFVQVTKQLQIESQEIDKLLAKIDQVYIKLKESRLTPAEYEAVDEVLGRAVYELETCGDEADIRLAKGAIKVAQSLIRNK